MATSIEMEIIGSLHEQNDRLLDHVADLERRNAILEEQLVSTAAQRPLDCIDGLQRNRNELLQRIGELERRLAASEARLALAQETAHLGMWEWSVAEQRVTWSQTLEMLCGLAAGSLPNSFDHFYACLHPDDRAPARAALQQALARQAASLAGEYRIVWPDGTIRRVASTVRLAYDEQGATVWMAGTLQDITARGEARPFQQGFAAAVEHSTDFIALTALDGQVLYLNQAGQRLVGLRSQVEALRTVMMDYIWPDDLVALQQHMLPTVLQAGHWTGDLQFRHFKTGHALPVRCTLFVVKDAQTGQPIGLGSVAHDVRGNPEAEAARLALQEEIIAAQRAAIRELGTRLLPIDDGVVVLPLIGTIDSTRAQQVLETLLEGVATCQATIVIIDITGVEVVDTHVANALIQVARSVQVLGAEVVLTGIQPRIAATLVGPGAELHRIVAQSTLQEGIAYALGQAYTRRRPLRRRAS